MGDISSSFFFFLEIEMPSVKFSFQAIESCGELVTEDGLEVKG